MGAGGRNDPSLVCTYELKKKRINVRKWKVKLRRGDMV
jgi:hypothetical protein